jgi:hypothetical protein
LTDENARHLGFDSAKALLKMRNGGLGIEIL